MAQMLKQCDAMIEAMTGGDAEPYADGENQDAWVRLRADLADRALTG